MSAVILIKEKHLTPRRNEFNKNILKKRCYVLAKWLVNHCVSQAERTQDAFSQQEVMSVEDESTSCYCLLDPFACPRAPRQLWDVRPHRGTHHRLCREQLKVAVFGCLSCNSLDYNLRVYCVDNTPWAFQVSLSLVPLVVSGERGVSLKIGVNRESDYKRPILDNEPTSLAQWGYPSRNRNCVTVCHWCAEGTMRYLALKKRGGVN